MAGSWTGNFTLGTYPKEIIQQVTNIYEYSYLLLPYL